MSSVAHQSPRSRLIPPDNILRLSLFVADPRMSARHQGLVSALEYIGGAALVSCAAMGVYYYPELRIVWFLLPFLMTGGLLLAGDSLRRLKAMTAIPELIANLDAIPRGTECVYVLRGGGLYKIGRSQNLERRLHDLQRMSAVPLSFAALFVCGSDTGFELLLHHTFADCREHGEWFALTDEDLLRLWSLPRMFTLEDARARL